MATDFDQKEDEMFLRKNRKRIPGELTNVEVLGSVLGRYGQGEGDSIEMFPPEPDWRCKCGEEGRYTEENKTTLERKEKIKCPKCGKDVKALSLVER